MKIFQRIFPIVFFSLRLTIGQDHSINFDGNNDYILIPDHAALDLTENYTLEAWIFPESFSWLGGIISKYQTSAANGYLLRLTHQSPYTGLGFDETVTSTGLLNDNQWYHIAAVKSGGSRKLYVNGIEQSHEFLDLGTEPKALGQPWPLLGLAWAWSPGSGPLLV